MGFFDWFFKPKDPYLEEIDNILYDFEHDISSWFFNGWNSMDRSFNTSPDYVMSPFSFFSNIFKFGYDYSSMFNDELDKGIENHFNKRLSDIKDYRSVEIKSILGPDGILKKIEKVRNKDGSERIKIINRKGNKEYVIEKFKDKNGKEEIKESVTNNNKKPDIKRFGKNPKKKAPIKNNSSEDEVWIIPENIFNMSPEEEVFSC